MKLASGLLRGGFIVWMTLLSCSGARAQSHEETSLWQSVSSSKDAEDYKAYLDKYPNGVYAPVAKRRIASLEATPETTPATKSRAAPAAVKAADKKKPAPDAAKAFPTDEAANAEIDVGFQRWSSTWMFDRYVVGSARATDRGLKDETYVVRGLFDFVRSGTKITIPFAAAYAMTNDHYALSNLCYNDTSSGMTDCINPNAGLGDRQAAVMQSRQFLGSIVLLGMVAAMSEDEETCVKRYTFFGEAYYECE